MHPINVAVITIVAVAFHLPCTAPFLLGFLLIFLIFFFIFFLFLLWLLVLSLYAPAKFILPHLPVHGC